jgi:type II secretory pathway component PulF
MKLEGRVVTPIKISFFLNSILFGFFLFWAVGLWLIPEKFMAGRYIRAWMGPLMFFGFVGSLIHEKATARWFRGIGLLFLAAAFAVFGGLIGFLVCLIFGISSWIP